MDLKEMRMMKKAMGYSNEDLARKSGVPLSTVQKVMSGINKKPRQRTWEALEKALTWKLPDKLPYAVDRNGMVTKRVDWWDPDQQAFMLREESVEYGMRGGYTLDDIRKLPDDIWAELIDGKMYFFAAPTRTHQKICGGMYLAVANYLKSSGKDCEVYIPPYGVWPEGQDGDLFLPDLTVICDHDKSVEDGCIGAPDWIVEVLSPSTRRKDLGLKLRKYMQAGVKLYWIIDPSKEVAVVHDNTSGAKEDKEWQTDIYSFEDEITCSLYPDLKIRIADLI